MAVPLAAKVFIELLVLVIAVVYQGRTTRWSITMYQGRRTVFYLGMVIQSITALIGFIAPIVQTFVSVIAFEESPLYRPMVVMTTSLYWPTNFGQHMLYAMTFFQMWLSASRLKIMHISDGIRYVFIPTALTIGTLAWAGAIYQAFVILLL